MAGSFVTAFIIASAKGQYDDLETPAYKILADDFTNHLHEEFHEDFHEDFIDEADSNNFKN